MSQAQGAANDAALFAQLDQKFAKIHGQSALDYAKEHGERFNDYLRFLDEEKDAIRKLVESQAAQVPARPHPKVIALGGIAPNPGGNTPAPPAVITSEAYWWGFHLVIPEACLATISNANDILKAISTMCAAGASAGAIGSAAAGATAATVAAAGLPATAVLCAAAAVAFAIEGVAIHAVDQGKGVYLSWCWLQVPCLAVFPAGALPVPTAIT